MTVGRACGAFATRRQPALSEQRRPDRQWIQQAWQ